MKANEKLVAEKETIKKELDASLNKRQKLQDNLRAANASVDFWKNSFKRIVKKQIQEERMGKIRKRKGISYSEYSERSKYRIRNELKEECQSALNFLGLLDLVPFKVTFYDPVEESFDSFSLIQ